MVVKRCYVTDRDMVDKILKDPEIYKHLGDDGSLPAENFTSLYLLTNPMIYMLKAIIEDDIAGLIGFYPRNFVSYDIHITVLPQYRGKTGVEVMKKAIDWMFENTPCRKVIANAPTSNRPAYALAIKCGFQKEGLLSKSYLKNGKLYDEHILGFSKEEAS